MRGIALVGGLVAVAAAAAVLTSVIWVNRSLAAVQAEPSSICLRDRDGERIASGNFPQSWQDASIVKAIKHRYGTTLHHWWHLRGITIHLTYVTFWSREARSEAFDRFVPRMRDCPRY